MQLIDSRGRRYRLEVRLDPNGRFMRSSKDGFVRYELVKVFL